MTISLRRNAGFNLINNLKNSEEITAYLIFSIG